MSYFSASLTVNTWYTGSGPRMSYFCDSQSIHGVQGVEPEVSYFCDSQSIHGVQSVEPGCLTSLIHTMMYRLWTQDVLKSYFVGGDVDVYF